MNAPRLLVAAPASGGGKTTVTLGLLQALVDAGQRVQAFKCGPDYIDPGHHARVTGRPSHNLDTWMIGPEASRELFCHYAAAADVAVIEGVMGLFDGRGGEETLAGSSADAARLLQAPVLLVLDVRAQAASAAAVALGFREYHPEVTVTGVILNRVGSARHAEMVRAAVERRAGLPVLGALPREEGVTVPERHLGLVTAEEAGLRAVYRRAGELVRGHVDLDRVLAVARSAPPLTAPAAGLFADRPLRSRRVAVARDAAFGFLYAANLDLLRAAGAAVECFSPLADEPVPEACDLLYLPGGYPELHAAALAGAGRFRASALAHAERRGRIYGECGGLMLLGRELLDLEGVRHPMLGLLPLSTRMTGRRRSLGYVEATAARDSLLAPAGAAWRGHEFHYSAVEPDAGAESCWTLRKSLAAESTADGWQRGTTLAGYLHTHFAAAPALLNRLLG